MHDQYKFELETLVESFEYKKIFVRKGELRGNTVKTDSKGVIEIDIPSNSTSINLKPINTNQYTKNGNIQEEIVVHVYYKGKKIKQSSITEDKLAHICIIDLNVSKNSLQEFDLINNSGSSIKFFDNPYDIGFGDKDSPVYNNERNCIRACGYAPIIKRSVFTSREIFGATSLLIMKILA